jgi:uncharacterized OB-fold protein
LAGDRIEVMPSADTPLTADLSSLPVQPARIAFRQGSLTDDLSDLAAVRLRGSRCRACGIALFGWRRRCENCGSAELGHEVYSSRGTVWSWTVQRYPPPAPFHAAAPWSPRPIAWIDLDEHGPRVLGPVRHDPDLMRVGLRVLLRCAVEWCDEGRDVVSYAFVSKALGAGEQ